MIESLIQLIKNLNKEKINPETQTFLNGFLKDLEEVEKIINNN